MQRRASVLASVIMAPSLVHYVGDKDRKSFAAKTLIAARAVANDQPKPAAQDVAA
jgi:hypothetical protein